MMSSCPIPMSHNQITSQLLITLAMRYSVLEKFVLKVHVDATLIQKDSMQIVVQPFYMMHTSPNLYLCLVQYFCFYSIRMEVIVISFHSL